MGEAAVLRILRRESGGEMSTSYYLVQTEPTPLYGRVKVAQSSGGETSLWHYDETPSGWTLMEIGAMYQTLPGRPR